MPRRLHLFGCATPVPSALEGLKTYAAGLASADDAPPSAAAPGAFAVAPFLFHDPGLLVALSGDPWWSGGPGADPLRPADRAARLASDYREFGERCFEKLHGRFACAIVDVQRQRTLLAVDRIGIEPLAYAVGRDGLVFGARADDVAGAPGREAQLRNQGLFDFLLLHMVPSPDTVYAGVCKLQPGSYVVYNAGTIVARPYFDPQFRETHAERHELLAQRLRVTLREAVADCRPDAHSGAFLSGGLDSSTVAGMLVAVRGAGAPTFSIGFGIEGYDELEYARIASRHFGTAPHEYVVTPADIVDALPQIAAAYDEPFGNSSAVPTYFCARLARQHGIGHLLAGDGGDEIFGGNERYARQKIFEAYRSIPGELRRSLIEPLARRISPDSAIMPLRKFRSYVDQASIAMPERGESWNFMYRADLTQMLDPEFAASIDRRYALDRMAEVYGRARAGSIVNRMLFFDWQYTLADNDLRKVGRMCELADVRVSFPMLDERLIELSLEVTPRQKVAGQNLRAFYKRALAGFLPPQIVRKKKHGFGLPFGVWLKSHRPLADLIYGLLTDLKQRRIVRGAFLDQLIADHRTGHPGYFGYAIWDLAMLEAWLAAHRSRV